MIHPRSRWTISLLLLALVGVASTDAALAQTISIPLQLPDETGAPTPSADALGRLAAALVNSSNFNSYSRPDAIGQSIPEIQEHYRRVAAGSTLVVTYPSPVKFHTVGGDLWVFQIVVGLGRPDHADALFTIDNAGRVVVHEKYSGETAVKLRQATDAALSAPGGAR